MQNQYSPSKPVETRPCACNGGWVTIGQIALDEETGEETEEFALYICQRCSGGVAGSGVS
jgi:hypothetical protein